MTLLNALLYDVIHIVSTKYYTHIRKVYGWEREEEKVGRFLPSDIVPTGMGGSVGFEDSPTLWYVSSLSFLDVVVGDVKRSARVKRVF